VVAEVVEIGVVEILVLEEQVEEVEVVVVKQVMIQQMEQLIQVEELEDNLLILELKKVAVKEL
jgi:hypothetical protein